MHNQIEKLASSFRDPAGFLFRFDGELFRQINPVYYPDFQHLIESGLYQELAQERLLISHQEVPYLDSKVIKPEKIPFISYPYEWSFSQLKDAALLTLNIQKRALQYGMSLKDASSYNVQFYQGKPIFIDTLSFARYVEGKPWEAYRQFCQHFLAPLMLMSYRDIRLNQLLKIYIDGIPLDLASNLLPASSKFKLSCALHIHMHAKMQKKYEQSSKVEIKKQKFTITILKHFIESLIQTVNKLTWKVHKKSEWYDYYSTNHNYTSCALNQKEMIINEWVKKISPVSLWDLGANIGRFSLIAAQHCQQVVSWDIDTSCVESFYQHTRQHNHTILPLILDLTNPSPSLGWAHHERQSLMERGPVDAILALGLIHHLAIVNNVPLNKIAEFFAALTSCLIIEFVPKEDSQVQKLLSTRQDIFPEYTLEGFESAFSSHFEIIQKISIEESNRTLYYLKTTQ